MSALATKKSADDNAKAGAQCEPERETPRSDADRGANTSADRHAKTHPPLLHKATILHRTVAVSRRSGTPGLVFGARDYGAPLFSRLDGRDRQLKAPVTTGAGSGKGLQLEVLVSAIERSCICLTG